MTQNPYIANVVGKYNNKMEQLQAHFEENSQFYKTYLMEGVRLVVGTMMMAITLISFYLITFLARIFRLPKNSREYIHKRQHIETQSLVRYSLTVLCILTIDFLLLKYFDDGPRLMLTGLVICFAFLVVKYVWGLVKPAKKGKLQ